MRIKGAVVELFWAGEKYSITAPLTLPHQARGELVAGLLYIHPEADDLHAHLNTVDTPFNKLGVKETCAGATMLGKLNASLR